MKKINSILILLTIAVTATAQAVTYEQYNKLVAENNTLYLAEKYNVDIATASLQAARIFNDPELSVSYSNNQDWSLQMGQSIDVGLSINPDFAGVRRARIAVADNDKAVTEASVMAFLSNLKLEAAYAWAEAWKIRESCSVLEESINDMMQIAQSDSLRLSVGEIGRAEALQSQLEARTLQGSLLTLQADYKNALEALTLLCGGKQIESLDGDLTCSDFIPDESEICALAETNRADLKASMLSKTLSENNLKLVKASRSFEMGIDLGYSYNTEVRNELAPAPQYNGLTVGITIPLKFSNFNKGEVNAARIQVQQSERYYEAARLQVRSEATQAFNSFVSSSSVLRQYKDSILDDARSIVLGRKEGYLRGESSLIEFLSAQQTYLEVMQAYIEAKCNCFICHAQLEQATGCSF